MERFCFTITLSSGVQVKEVIYERDTLINKWTVRIQKISGTNIYTDQLARHSLNEIEFKELIDKLLNTIKIDYGGKLDGIHIDFSIIEDLWEGVLRFLRNGGIHDRHMVKGKDIKIVHTLKLFLNQSKYIMYICEKARELGRTCGKKAADLNPIVFESRYFNKTWREIKDAPNAGIDKVKSWYGISLKLM
jgi:hypothetical protein